MDAPLPAVLSTSAMAELLIETWFSIEKPSTLMLAAFRVSWPLMVDSLPSPNVRALYETPY